MTCDTESSDGFNINVVKAAGLLVLTGRLKHLLAGYLATLESSNEINAMMIDDKVYIVYGI